MNMFKEKAMKPVEKIKKYLKYGFVMVEHQYMDCPRCNATLNAGPCYQPKYCDQCGQRLDFSEIEWKEDKELGFAREAAYESIQN